MTREELKQTLADRQGGKIPPSLDHFTETTRQLIKVDALPDGFRLVVSILERPEPDAVVLLRTRTGETAIGEYAPVGRPKYARQKDYPKTTPPASGCAPGVIITPLGDALPLFFPWDDIAGVFPAVDVLPEPSPAPPDRAVWKKPVRPKPEKIRKKKSKPEKVRLRAPAGRKMRRSPLEE